MLHYLVERGYDELKKRRIVDDKLKVRLELSGAMIAFYRKRRGLTQAQLAELVGRSRSYLGRIEACNGKTPQVPPIDFYYKVADALNLPITKLLEKEDE